MVVPDMWAVLQDLMDRKKQKESGHSDIAATPNDRKKGKPTKKISTLEKTQRI